MKLSISSTISSNLWPPLWRTVLLSTEFFFQRLGFPCVMSAGWCARRTFQSPLHHMPWQNALFCWKLQAPSFTAHRLPWAGKIMIRTGCSLWCWPWFPRTCCDFSDIEALAFLANGARMSTDEHSVSDDHQRLLICYKILAGLFDVTINIPDPDSPLSLFPPSQYLLVALLSFTVIRPSWHRVLTHQWS